MKPFWTCRLFDKEGNRKHYDFVEFWNGPYCGGYLPYFKTEFRGFEVVQKLDEHLEGFDLVSDKPHIMSYHWVILSNAVI